MQKKITPAMFRQMFSGGYIESGEEFCNNKYAKRISAIPEAINEDEDSSSEK